MIIVSPVDSVITAIKSERNLLRISVTVSLHGNYLGIENPKQSQNPFDHYKIRSNLSQQTSRVATIKYLSMLLVLSSEDEE